MRCPRPRPRRLAPLRSTSLRSLAKRAPRHATKNTFQKIIVFFDTVSSFVISFMHYRQASNVLFNPIMPQQYYQPQVKYIQSPKQQQYIPQPVYVLNTKMVTIITLTIIKHSIRIQARHVFLNKQFHSSSSSSFGRYFIMSFLSLTMWSTSLKSSAC